MSRESSRTWRTAIARENDRLNRERRILLDALAEATGQSLTTLVDATHGRIALAACTTEDAVREMERDYLLLLDRRALREPRSVGLRAQAQCPGCRRFVQSLARECPGCGYFGAAGYPG